MPDNNIVICEEYIELKQARKRRRNRACFSIRVGLKEGKPNHIHFIYYDPARIMFARS